MLPAEPRRHGITAGRLKKPPGRGERHVLAGDDRLSLTTDVVSRQPGHYDMVTNSTGFSIDLSGLNDALGAAGPLSEPVGNVTK